MTFLQQQKLTEFKSNAQRNPIVRRRSNLALKVEQQIRLALDSTFVKIVSWYDNEWGYSNKCLEMVRVISK